MNRACTDNTAILQLLKTRFEANMQRHSGIAWSEVQARLEGNAKAVQSLQHMQASGGEPDVVGMAERPHRFMFFDCAGESPTGRRSCCYDGAARTSRKENAPPGSALEMAAEMGIALLTEAQYRHLQTLGRFDDKTSSWIDTPAPVPALGGALFCDRRYGKVFTYHNGAQSCYAARGFRGALPA
jgi:hypothetical protein